LELELKEIPKEYLVRPYPARVGVVLREAIAGFQVEGAERANEGVAGDHAAREPCKQRPCGNLHAGDDTRPVFGST